MTLEWMHEQDEYLLNTKLWTQHTNGCQWTVQIIKFLWDRFFELWEKRNKVVHDKTCRASTFTKQVHPCKTIESMYHLKDQLLASDRKYTFQTTAELEEILSTKTTRLPEKYGLHYNGLKYDQSKKKKKKKRRPIIQMKTIYEYFPLK
eukprot:9826884-Ditylum_brightwellii.AAC.1